MNRILTLVLAGTTLVTPSFSQSTSSALQPTSCLSPTTSSTFQATSSTFPPTSTSSQAPTTTCVGLLENATISEVANFTFDELFCLTTRFLDAFIFPNNVIQTESINSTLFAGNIIGRVDATRDFIGQELNTEYVFGTFAQQQLEPQTVSLLGAPTSYNIVRFAGSQNVVAFSVIIDVFIKPINTTIPTEWLIYFTFNSNGEISQYDVTIRYLNRAFEYIYGLAQEELQLNSTAAVQAYLTTALAESICGIAQQYCNGSNLQYDSPADCMDFLTHDIRFGQSDEFGMNTLLCRMVHQVMVPFRPSVHCPHIGKTGGGYCVDDLPYVGTVLEPLFINAPFVPYGYGSQNATIAAEK